MEIQSFLNNLLQKQDLTPEESGLLLAEMIEGSFTEVQISALLTASAMKGETVNEIIGFIRTMREHMLTVGNGLKPFPTKNTIDVCGSGGDGKKTFNISTAVAFVVAGAGVPVAKHGNRSASSLCGSADVLEKLGVYIDISAKQAEIILENVGMVFLFAPLFHPSMKRVSLVRKELKIRTIFNYLGPFTNPASVERQLIGVPSIAIAEKLAQVAKKLDYERLLIVTSEDGMDEISISTKTYIYQIETGLQPVSRTIIDPTDYGFRYTTNNDLRGGDAALNARMIQEILDGKQGACRDIVVFNSAFALYAAGVSTIAEGIKLAEKAIDTGSARIVLENLIKETQKYA